ncbi:hypothetical protein [Streptomyces celluloflavus]|uniref:hypothetical protein n=1 Tax=Streptomyces celluloflavus TaxID=58344 RepID=UPI00369C5DE9
MIDMKPKEQDGQAGRPGPEGGRVFDNVVHGWTLNLYTDVKVKSMEKQVREQGAV